MISISLFLVLLLARGIVVGGGGAMPWSPGLSVALIWHDGVIVLGFGLLEVMARRSRITWWMYGALVLHAAINVPVFLTLGTPITAPMMRGTGGALTDSLLHHATAPNLIAVAAVLTAGVLAPVLLRRRSLSRRRAVLFGIGLLITTLTGAAVSTEVDTRGRHRHGIVLWTRSFSPDPLPEGVEWAERDWRKSLVGSAPGPDLRALRGVARGRDVVLILLESAAARYLRPYGAPRDPMPHLTRWAGQGLLFENAYAVYPESIKGFWALLTARSPALNTLASDYHGVGAAAIPEVLRSAGYRTGLFHSGRFSYLGMDEIIQDRGFERLVDAATISGEVESSFGVDEFSTVEAILGWTASLRPEEPFFVAYLPVAGHHPYDTPEAGPFDDSDDLGAYHNALHYADRALHRLRRGLERQGRDDRTLYVILGDHGQAFGDHPDNYGHVFHLYEENVRVPLVFLAPGRDELSGRGDGLASALDVRPTLLDLLGLDPGPRLEGRSLLDPEARLVLFFTDYSDRRVGLRDGPWKFIHDLDSGKSRLYDLSRDARETHDLSARHPGRVLRFRRHLLDWCGARRSLILAP